MKRIATLAGIACLATLGSAHAGEPAVTYSSLCVSEQTGDIGGRRLVVLHFNAETYVVFQQGEGGLIDPELAKADYNAKTGALKFHVNFGNQNISGTLTDKAFTYSEYDVKNVLPRITDVKAALPVCG